MSLDTGTDLSTLFWSWPPWPTRACVIQIAIQFSMIVEITSCTPTVAFRKPAIAAQAAPAAAASTIVITMCSPEFMFAQEAPTQAETNAPTMYWPWPPMLNRPHLNANETREAGQDQASRQDQRLLEVEGGLGPRRRPSPTGRASSARCRRRSP